MRAIEPTTCHGCGKKDSIHTWYAGTGEVKGQCLRCGTYWPQT